MIRRVEGADYRTVGAGARLTAAPGRRTIVMSSYGRGVMSAPAGDTRRTS